MNEILKYLDIISPAVMLFTAGVFCLFKKQKLHLADVIVLSYLFLQFVLNTTATLLQDRFINNHWVYHLNSIVTVSLFFIFHFRYILPNHKHKLILSYTIFCLIFLLNLFFLQKLEFFNSYTYAICSFIIVLWQLVYFYKILNDLPIIRIGSTKEFWLGVSILFYFGSSFFIFISYNYLSFVSPLNVGILWKAHNIIFAITCILFFKIFTSEKWIQKSYW